MSTSHKFFVVIAAVLLFASASPLVAAQPTAQTTATVEATQVATPAVLPETGAAQTSEAVPGVLIALLIGMLAAFVLAGISVYMLATRSR